AQGDPARALAHLETIAKRNLDRTAVMELRARYLLELGRWEEARAAYEALLERNSDYREYYLGLEKASGLDRAKQEDHPRLQELYRSWAEKGERADAPARIPL